LLVRLTLLFRSRCSKSFLCLCSYMSFCMSAVSSCKIVGWRFLGSPEPHHPYSDNIDTKEIFLKPTIYSFKKLILYYHFVKEILSSHSTISPISTPRTRSSPLGTLYLSLLNRWTKFLNAKSSTSQVTNFTFWCNWMIFMSDILKYYWNKIIQVTNCLWIFMSLSRSCCSIILRCWICSSKWKKYFI